ncbi:MAG: lipopolysaccharide transport system ATP-binding protein [Acidobacteriota bacterium]|nr:lipopolysaccharide transport system ATP-binding protein [Acidobacteriota bacterium]
MSNIAVKFENVSKFYKLYNSPKDRLKEALHPFGKKRHREFYALKNINLEVKKGEILGIVGRNGSGKSTLLKIISGVIQPNSGKVIVKGDVSALLELGSGMNPDYDGIQNIYFGGIMMGFSREEMKAKIDDIVAFAEIGDFIHQPLKTYSSGMKARLGFALAINIKPEILVVDEVLSVGDDLFKRKCFAKMEELFKSGCTVFFVSHSIPNVMEICTRAILVDKGELILEGSPKLVTMNYLKLIYALPNDQAEIRNEILQLDKNEEEKENFDSRLDTEECPSPASEKLITRKEKKEPKIGQEAFHIPDFKPKSTVIIKNEDVSIYDMRIETLEGQEVNALVMNEEYIYSYKVEFGVLTRDVNFGMGIKTEKGLALAWMIYPGINQFLKEEFVNGDKIHLKWRFKCMLLPGNYYIDSGLRTMKKDKTYILSKITDALAFKVQENEGKQKGGFFDALSLLDMTKI